MTTKYVLSTRTFAAELNQCFRPKTSSRIAPTSCGGKGAGSRKTACPHNIGEKIPASNYALGSGTTIVSGTVGVGLDSKAPLLPFSNFGSSSALVGTSVGSHASALSTLVISHLADGSGSNGPEQADYALQIVSQKRNYLTSTINGEIDAGYVITRQGRSGDAGGLLFDTKKVLSGTIADSGGITPIEGESGWINSSGKPISILHWIPGFIEGRGGLSGGTGYGMYVESRRSQLYSGFASIDYNAYGGVSGSYGWQNAFVSCADRLAFACYYRIAGAVGRTGAQEPGDEYQGYPAEQTITRTDKDGTWHLRNAKDTTDLLIITQSGQLRLEDGSLLQGVWPTYIPNITCGNGNGSGFKYKARGAYSTIGKTLNVAISFKIITLGSCRSELLVQAPASVALGGVLPGVDSRSKHALMGNVATNGTIHVADYSGGFPFADGSTVTLSGTLQRQ